MEEEVGVVGEGGGVVGIVKEFEVMGLAEEPLWVVDGGWRSQCGWWVWWRRYRGGGL